MVSFLDGPAACEILLLRRAPLFLRVVFNPRKKTDQWDALDQLDDVPKPHEEITVYRRKVLLSPMHLKCSQRSASGYYANAKYEVAPEQPDDATVRDVETWRAWCLEQQAAEKAKEPR